MSSITRNNFSIHSNLKGNLLKTEYQKDGIVYFVKSGRLQVRDFPEKWGIEPVIEVLCYEIGKLMGLNVAEQSLIGMEGIRYGKNFRTLVCSSPDFRNGKTLIYLASLYAEDESNIDFEKLCRNTGCGNNLINLLAFDLIIMNEDRHNSNVGFLMSDNGELKLSPIYDNGYSLLYDDIKGMLNDFKSAYKYCLCNAPLYEERFNAAERIFQKMSKIYAPTINLNIERSQVADRIMAVKKTYSELVYADINNIELKDIWWEKVIDFVCGGLNMLEIYEIVWRNENVTGYLEYNTKTDKFQAYLKDRENPNPRGLFGILKISDVVEDSRVRLYISDCVVPKTRENIDDILKHLGMGEYNQWEIYKKNMGVNVSDYACIRFYKNSDSNDFFYPI